MQTLEEKLEQKKNEIGLVGTRVNLVRPTTGEGISEYITHDWKEIVISIKQNIDLAPDPETKRYLKKRQLEPLETVALDLLQHGCGHRELPTETQLGCPYTVENHDIILDAIARALKEKGKENLASYVANAFEDVIDNVNVRKHSQHAGQILFWNNEALENKKKFPAFYEAFVKINMALWGTPQDATLLRRFYANTKPIQKAVQQYTDDLKRTLGVTSLLRTHEKERSFKRLFNSHAWGNLAYQFAKATADLLEDHPTMRLCFGSQPGEQYFDRLIKLPGTQEDLAYTRYQQGKSPSHHTDPELQLDAFYRKTSRQIPVKTSDYVKASAMPIAHFGRRNPKEDETIKRTKIKGFGFTEEGNLTLKVAKHELHHPATYKIHPRNFPHLKIALLDTSGSMASSPENDGNIGSTSFIPWGDNSKYHFALKGLYGIDNFLEKQGVAPYITSEAITFASATTPTGKRKLRSEEERRALLKKPSGGTSIDVALLKAELNEKCFLISVSDGDIENWDTIKEEYKKAIERNDYCHIHIGGKNQFTADLESWNIPVHYVKGNEDVSKLMIDATAHYYREKVPTKVP